MRQMAQKQNIALTREAQNLVFGAEKGIESDADFGISKNAMPIEKLNTKA